MSSREDRPKTPKGSIRAARERAEAGLPHPDASPSATRPMQWPLSSSGTVSPIVVSPPKTPTSRRTPPMSPLTNSPEATPPRRMERPRNVPPTHEASNGQDPPTFLSTISTESERTITDTQQQQDQGLQPTWRQGNVLLSPGEPSTPGAGLSGTSNSSRPSTTSSFGSIPDFPVPSIPDLPPQPQGPPRRSMGPPPSARRGVSSYYSHNSYVTPIPEEHHELQKQHNSYASSHAVPKSWVDGPPEYYTTAYEEDEEDDGRESRDSRSTEPDDNTNLVRKASLGRQFKPSLTTVRSNSSSSSEHLKSADDNKRAAGMGAAGVIAAAAGAGYGNAEMSRNAGIELLPSKAYTGVPSEDGQSTTRGTPAITPRAARSGSATPRNVPADPRVRQILGGLEKGGAIGDPDDLPPSAIRRPPRLDVAAVREAESRGSMTSLPDLIKRATRLASNLDKGRTASRMGMLDMFNSSDPNLLSKLNQHRDQQLRQGQRDSTISGMLSSFPAPVLTPTQDRHDQTWGSPYHNNSNRELMTPTSPMKGEKAPRRPGRRCCGLPLWAFMIIMLVLTVLIAAAVVIPILLIVVPRSHQTAATASDLSNCPSTSPCSHGGMSVVSNNACQCVCTGGFSGASCTASNDGSCTQTDVGNYKGATMGSDVSRLFGAANSFQIPLNATAILGTFAASNISCSSENALMTFNGQSQRRAVPVARAPEPQAVTSNGIVLATAASGGASALPTAATVSGTAAPSPTGPSGTDEDLARVAILWTLQKTLNLNTAYSVQQKLTSSLQDGSFSKGAVNAGAGVVVDFSAHTLTANGTKIGG